MRVLLVEDDVRISQFLVQGLREEGHTVHTERTGPGGLSAARGGAFDVLILDRMLPGLDGAEVCRTLRSEGQVVAILILTARDTVADRVAGLDAGADDYLVKPFAFAELLARLRALGRRPPPRVALTLRGLCLDPVARRVTFEGHAVELSAREFSLLHLFLHRPDHLLSRTVILESVWGYDFQTETNLVDVYVNYLRRKLKAVSGQEWIESVRSQGYRFRL